MIPSSDPSLSSVDLVRPYKARGYKDIGIVSTRHIKKGHINQSFTRPTTVFLKPTMFTKHLIFIAAVLAIGSSANCIHGTELHKRELLPGGKVKVSSFGYTGLQGPLNWAGLSEKNFACSTSSNQSPINIDQAVGLASKTPEMHIEDVKSAEFENLGSTVEVLVNGTTDFGIPWKMSQFHFHTPAEHRIDEEFFPLEMHMVHTAAGVYIPLVPQIDEGDANLIDIDGSGKVLVVAVLFQLTEDGSTTELLTAVTKNIAHIATPGDVTETGPLHFGKVIDHVQSKRNYQYGGSLTTPPCTENVTFLISRTPMPVNVATFNKMKKVIKFNARYSQNAPNHINLLQNIVIEHCGPSPQNFTV